MLAIDTSRDACISPKHTPVTPLVAASARGAEPTTLLLLATHGCNQYADQREPANEGSRPELILVVLPATCLRVAIRLVRVALVLLATSLSCKETPFS